MRWLAAVPVAAVCLGLALADRPLKGTQLTELSSPGSDDKQKRVAENIKPLLPSPDSPISCENFRKFADEAILRWHKMEGTHLIVIARPGDGEQRRDLSITRLRKIEAY